MTRSIFGPGIISAGLLMMGLYQLVSNPVEPIPVRRVEPEPSHAIADTGLDMMIGTSGSTSVPGSKQGSQPESQPGSLPPVAANSYGAVVLRVIDGDTVAVRVPVWLGQELVTKVRLKGIDAPELNGACASEIARAEADRAALIALIDGRPVHLTDLSQDKYGGRVVARLLLGSGVDAGAALMAAGHAKPWRGRRETGWCSLPLPRG
jgi:micrococcal nuclease